jgi:hypothetical protein
MDKLDEVDGKRPLPREEAVRVDAVRRVDVGRVGGKRPRPREEATSINNERRANVDGVGERWPKPHEDATRTLKKRQTDEDGVDRQAPSIKREKGARQERQKKHCQESEDKIPCPKTSYLFFLFHFFYNSDLTLQYRDRTTNIRCCQPDVRAAAARDRVTADARGGEPAVVRGEELAVAGPRHSSGQKRQSREGDV